MHPRLLVVDLVNKKVKGLIHIKGILIDNIECDEEGNGFAYVFLLGKKHIVVKVCNISQLTIFLSHLHSRHCLASPIAI